MKLTKKQAVDYSIELWAYLAKTGKKKEDWPEWGRFGELNKDGDCEEVEHLCFLCEYGAHKINRDKCDVCPYATEFDVCCPDDDTPFSQWYDATTIRDHKKYAKLFLEQLKQIRGK